MGSLHLRRAIGGALFATVLSLGGCAHVLHSAHDAGVTPPIATCTPEAPLPTPEVLSGKSGGLVFVDFTVQTDGSITDLAPGAEEPHPDEALYSTAVAWLKQCKFKPAMLDGSTIPARTSKGTGFYQPYAIDHDGAPPIDWNDASARELSAPRFAGCHPQDPPVLDNLDDARMSIVVQRDGHAGDMRLAEHLGEEDPGPYPFAALWLRTCHFTPARNKDGAPIAVRIPLPLLFNDALAQPPIDNRLPLADGAALPIPQPTSNCDSHPWPFESTAGAAAPIEVEYTVDTLGNAANVTLRSPARHDVFHAVRRYLLGCHFMAVHDETGQPVEVRVHRTFHLQQGAQKPSMNGGQQSAIEGDPPF